MYIKLPIILGKGCFKIYFQVIKCFVPEIWTSMTQSFRAHGNPSNHNMWLNNITWPIAIVKLQITALKFSPA